MFDVSFNVIYFLLFFKFRTLYPPFFGFGKQIVFEIDQRTKEKWKTKN